jgi:hydrogenase 3 maturation protease
MFGPLVAKSITGKVAAEVINAENVPENYLGKIAKLTPDVVLLIDSAHFGGEAGQIRLLDTDELNESSFSTHSASLKLIEAYFQDQCQSKVMLLGAQPKHVRFGQPPSEQMVAAVDLVSQLLMDILKD